MSHRFTKSFTKLSAVVSSSSTVDLDADSSNDTLTLEAGTGISFTATAASDTLVIAASGGGGGGLSLTTETFTFDDDTAFWSGLTGVSSYTEVEWDTGVNLPAGAILIDIIITVSTAFNNMGSYDTIGPYFKPSSSRLHLFTGDYMTSYGPSSYSGGKVLGTAGTSVLKNVYKNDTSNAFDLKFTFVHTNYGTPTAPSAGAASVIVHYLS